MNQLSPYLQELRPTVAQLNRSTNPNHLSSMDLGLVSFVMTFPVLLIMVVAGYRKYRNRLLRSQILMLERIWNLKPQEYR